MELQNPTTTSTTTSNWMGVNSMFLYALEDEDRRAHLDALQANGIHVVRVFLRHIPAGWKGSSARTTPDLEDHTVGIYDDTILTRMDELMFECAQRNIKLIIGLHDRWSLGCWAKDAYVSHFGLVDVSPYCDWQTNQPAAFYQSDGHVFVDRLRHILKHPNPFFDNRPWSDLDEAVLAFQAENEPQGHMATLTGHNKTWSCAMANVMRQELNANIMVSTGGSGTLDESMADYLFECEDIDIVTLHSYEGDSTVVQEGLQSALQKSRTAPHQLRLILEEFGVNNRMYMEYFRQVLGHAVALGIPAMPWEFLRPSNSMEYEFFTDDVLWEATLSANENAVVDASGTASFDWPEMSAARSNDRPSDANDLVTGVGEESFDNAAAPAMPLPQPSLPNSLPHNHCGCVPAECSNEVLNTALSNPLPEGSTCLEWLEWHFETFGDIDLACKAMGYSFPNECSACNPDFCQREVAGSLQTPGTSTLTNAPATRINMPEVSISRDPSSKIGTSTSVRRSSGSRPQSTPAMVSHSARPLPEEASTILSTPTLIFILPLVILAAVSLLGLVMVAFHSQTRQCSKSKAGHSKGGTDDDVVMRKSDEVSNSTDCVDSLES